MQRILATKQHSAEGFTLIELLISLVLCGVIVTVFVSTLFTMMRTATIQKTQLELSQQNQIALDTIERDVRVAKAFDTTPSYTTFVDKYGPTNTNEDWTGTWTYKGTDANHRVLILRESATSTNPLQVSRTPVYAKGFIDNPYADTDANLNCTAYNASTAPTGGLAYNPMLPYYIIYFVRDGNLYRRILTDTTTALCNTQYQKQSCPSIDTSRPATCLANDELITTNVASFTVTYNTLTYDTNGAVTTTDINAYSLTDSDIFSEIDNIVVTLRLQKTVGGSTPNTTLSVRVSRVN